MALEESKDDDDIEVEANGLNIIMDNRTSKHLDGCKIDYVNSVFGGSFSIKSDRSYAC